MIFFLVKKNIFAACCTFLKIFMFELVRYVLKLVKFITCFMLSVLFYFDIILGVEDGDPSKENSTPDLVACPPVPPIRKHRRRHTPPRPPSNGLPPTPKVHMGACFSKVNINKICFSY